MSSLGVSAQYVVFLFRPLGLPIGFEKVRLGIGTFLGFPEKNESKNGWICEAPF